MIKTSNLNKYFNKGKSNEIHVINQTSIELPSTGLISFLGHSGCGKTTLLNVLGGLDKASGQIAYDDFELKKYNMHKMDMFRSKHIGYVFQNYNLLLEESVYDNLRIALEIIGVTDETEVQKRIEYTLKAVGMFKFRKKKAFALSGGQQQRVSIARALIKNCKIIIADEPTGNLDSSNTIEVMNILKKISKNALVLLVTHEKDIAEFYSDYIFELQDGKVVQSREITDTRTLQVDKGNVAYLKDMKQITSESQLGKITLYQDEGNDVKIDVQFVVKNGTIYIQSNQNIKLASTSNLRIVDDNYKEIKSTDIEDFVYDTSWYKDEKDNKQVLKNFWHILKNSFHRLFRVKKRVKFLYFALATIGIILSISVIALINASKIDESQLVYNEKYSSVADTSYDYSVNAYIESALRDNAIDNILVPYKTRITIEKRITYQYIASYSIYAGILPFQEENTTLTYGKQPQKDDEVCVSLSIVQALIKSSFVDLSPEEVIGETIKIYDTSFTVCGITTQDNKFLYTTLNAYCELQFGKSMGYDYKWVESAWDYRYSEYEKTADGTNMYTIIEGVDVSKDENKKELLISQDYKESSGLQLGDKFSVEEEQYTIVGTFSYPYKVENMVILNQLISLDFVYAFDSVYFPSNNYTLVSGREAQNIDEIIVSAYSNSKIGDTFYGKKIVGIYLSGTDLIHQSICTLDSALLNMYYADYVFNVTDERLAKDIFSEAGFEFYDNKTAQIKEEQFYNESITLGFKILSAVMAIVGFIFIYFIMRSKMISDIYSIGVHRALGASRAKLCRRFLLDVVILTTVTTLMGYALMSIAYFGFSSMMNNVLGMQVLMMSDMYIIVGALALYAMMIFAGILPIILLLRKTPAQILAKYDI